MTLEEKLRNYKALSDKATLLVGESLDTIDGLRRQLATDYMELVLSIWERSGMKMRPEDEPERDLLDEASMALRAVLDKHSRGLDWCPCGSLLCYRRCCGKKEAVR